LDALKSEAYVSGRRAGLGSLSPSLNPHPPGTAEHDQWAQGWQSGTADRARDAMNRQRAA
jgi:ribosome modulation factor